MGRYSGYLSYVGDSGSLLPPGIITPAMIGSLSASDWLLCDGSIYAKSAYPQLSRVLPSAFTSTAGTLPVNGSSISAFAAGAGLFVVPLKSTGIAITSPDGTTWTQRTLPVSSAWISCAWNGSVFCAISNTSGTIAATSPDGITWTQRTLPATATWTSIVWTGTQFIAGASNATTYGTSPDGITWTARTFPSSINPNYLMSNGSTTVAYSLAGAPLTSSDGINWTQQTSPAPSTVNWNQGIYDGSQFIMPGSNAALLIASPDGVTWTLRYTPFAIAAVGKYSNNLTLIAVGGTATVSSDLMSWQTVTISPAPSTTVTVMFWTGTKMVLLPASSNTYVTIQLDNANFTVPQISQITGGSVNNAYGNFFIKT